MTKSKSLIVCGVIFLVLLVAIPAQTLLPLEVTLFENGNLGAVLNNPGNPTIFSLDYPHKITYIETYHWNSAQGKAPGHITLRHSDGTRYGPWAASSREGYLGVPNAYWMVTPHEVIKTGTYTLTTSDPTSWSHNSASGHRGFATVKGIRWYGDVPDPDNRGLESIQARATAFKFYEQPYDNVPFEERAHSRTFEQQSTRYVAYELHLEYAAPGEVLEIPLTVRYYRPDGSEMGTLDHTIKIQPNWTRSWHSWSWGWKEPGNWPTGRYTVKVFEGEREITTGTFQILTDREAADTIFDWVQDLIPSLARQNTEEEAGVFYRYFPEIDFEILTEDGRLYLMGPDYELLDCGEVNFWLSYIEGSEETDTNSPPITIQGPNGSLLNIPTGAMNGGVQVSLEASPDLSGLIEEGETQVSDAVRINVSVDHAIFGDGSFTLELPITLRAGLDPDRLKLRIRLASGLVLPVFGIYDQVSGSFQALLSGLINGWDFVVIEVGGPKVQRFSLGDAKQRQNKGAAAHPKAWLTSPDWQTHAWHAQNHWYADDQQYAATQVEIQEVLTALLGATQTLDEAGFRSPKIHADPRLSPPARVVHFAINLRPGSHFASTFREEDLGFSMILITDEELTALGQIYVDMVQLRSLQDEYGRSLLDDLVIHELYHGVQSGYDIRRTRPPSSDVHTLRAYYEGTATPLGQSYRENDGSIRGPNAIVRPWTPPAWLNIAVDNPVNVSYQAQDFFTYVTRRYENSSFRWTAQLFEDMHIRTANQFNQSVNRYLELYRLALDDTLRLRQQRGLAEIYREYALDRAYIHSSHALLRSSEAGWRPNTLERSLFQPNGIARLEPANAQRRQVQFTGIKPLSTYAVEMNVDDLLPTGEFEWPYIFNMNISMTGGALRSEDFEGVNILIMLEDDKTKVWEIEVNDLTQAVQIPITQDIRYIKVLIMNCHLADRTVDMTITPGPTVTIQGDREVLYQLKSGETQYTHRFEAVTQPDGTYEFEWDFGDGSDPVREVKQPGERSVISKTYAELNGGDALHVFLPSVKLYSVGADRKLLAGDHVTIKIEGQTDNSVCESLLVLQKSDVVAFQINNNGVRHTHAIRRGLSWGWDGQFSGRDGGTVIKGRIDCANLVADIDVLSEGESGGRHYRHHFIVQGAPIYDGWNEGFGVLLKPVALQRPTDLNQYVKKFEAVEGQIEYKMDQDSVRSLLIQFYWP